MFRHKIISISLFKPNEETGNLGHVNHSFSKYSIYQRTGNFFIGAAPMIFGSLVLLGMLYWLVPNGREIFLPLAQEQTSFFGLISSLQTTLGKLFAIENLSAWNFWVFLYLSFCITAHISPSKKDRQGMWKGLIWLIMILILVNLITLSLKIDITQYILNTGQYLGVLIGIFIYAITISLIHFILSTVILNPLQRKR